MTNTTPSPANEAQKLGKGMIIATWLIVLGLLTAFFSNWLDAKRNPNQQVASLINTDGTAEVTLIRNSSGHYVATGYINERAVEMIVDTGATAVTVPLGLANLLGLRKGPEMQAETANGTITTYATLIDKIQIGDIVLHDIGASINPYSDQVLLGMTVLKKLEFTQRGNTLTLRQYPQ